MMTLEAAAKKQYLMFMKRTLQQYQTPILWEDLPGFVQLAWKEVIRTCPISKGRIQEAVREYNQREGTLPYELDSAGSRYLR